MDEEEKKAWSDFEKKTEAFVSVVEKGGTEAEAKAALEGFKKSLAKYKALKVENKCPA